MSLINDILDRSAKARKCPCPHCGHRLDDETEDMVAHNLITYWGEDGVIEVECSSCVELFYVREWVTREYSVGKTNHEADELDMQRYK